MKMKMTQLSLPAVNCFLFWLENYEVLQDVLVTGEVERLKDGLYNFEHEWLKGLSPDLDFEQDVVLDGNQIWTADLRSRI